METVGRRPSSSSSGSQEHGLNSFLDHPSPFGDLPSSPEEIENVASSLAIAFKTDKLTLLRRLEIQTRLRDQSEINVANEIQALKLLVQEIDPEGESGARSELARRLEEQIETLHRSARYVSSAAEMYGAVQQEKRLFQSMEVITKHVENLRQALEDERHAHEETRKLLKENKPLLSSKSQNSNGKRRASIATLDQGHPSPDGRLSASRKGSLIKRFGSCKSSSYSELNLGLRKVSDAGALGSSSGAGRLTDSPVTEHSGDEDGNSNQCTNEDCTCRDDANHLLGDDCDDTDDFERPAAKATFPEEEVSVTRKHPMRYKFKKRGSFIAPRWFMKLAEEWGWVQGGRVADAVTQLRYAAAGLCLLAAFAVLSSSFFLSADL